MRNKIIIKYLSLSLFHLFFFITLNAQIDSTISTIDSSFYGISAVVQIDSIVIKASKKGLDIQDFINFMLEDESFYHAFKNLRTQSYSFSNQLEFYDKKINEIASYNGIAQQKFDGKCRRMNVLSEEINGAFTKDGHYSHYTTKLYDRIFITHGEVCSQSSKSALIPSSKSKLEQHISMLKKLIFSPGIEADVPLVGKKMAIFSKKMSKYYTYELTAKSYKNEEVYLFRVALKPKYQAKKRKKTIIKYLDTYFDKENLQVLSRNYQLAYKNALYNFDIKIDIHVEKHKDKYVPTHISYDGFWDLAFKKPEIAKFDVEFFDFQ